MSALREMLSTGCTSVCRAWIVTRRDGAVFGFTDHDNALKVAGVQCLADSGLTAGSLERGTGLAVDNSEVSGALRHDIIDADDIRAGRWDNAEIVSYLVDWTEPTSLEILFRGNLGEITWGDGVFSAELRSQTEKLNQVRGRQFQQRCDAAFGDERCGVELGPLFTVETTVRSVRAEQHITTDLLRAYAPRWFEHGRLIVRNGMAVGQEGRIKTDRSDEEGRTFTLSSSLRSKLRAGDRVQLVAGCDKRRNTCRLKFANLLNFRGFPTIPGDDWLTAYPTKHGSNDGGKL